jgi:hypothetical protein
MHVVLSTSFTAASDKQQRWFLCAGQQTVRALLQRSRRLLHLQRSSTLQSSLLFQLRDL